MVKWMVIWARCSVSKFWFSVVHYSITPLQSNNPQRKCVALLHCRHLGSRGDLNFVVTLTTHKDVRSYPCRSLESAIKLAERFIAGVTKPAQRLSNPQPSTLNPQPLKQWRRKPTSPAPAGDFFPLATGPVLRPSTFDLRISHRRAGTSKDALVTSRNP
jgi:hypothetical protein